MNRLWILFLIWMIVSGSGIASLLSLKAIPGDRSFASLNRNPIDFESTSQGRKLVLFLDESCPCSFASVEVFDRLLTRWQPPSSAWVVFSHEVSSDSGPQESSFRTPASSRLRDYVAKLPKIQMIEDHQGLAIRYGVKTSGHVLLFGIDDQLLFSGGITPSRGHVGGSKGYQQLDDCLQTDPKFVQTSPVFGCGLSGDMKTFVAGGR